MLIQLFKSRWHDCSTIAGTILQELLAQFFSSHWHGSSTVTGMLVQQSLAQFFNSHWHNCSLFNDTIIQKSLARFLNSQGNLSFLALTWFFNITKYQEYETLSLNPKARQVLRYFLCYLFYVFKINKTICCNNFVYSIWTNTSKNINNINDTHREKLVLYWIQYKNSLKYKVGCFWRFSYICTID